jgi:E3 ubiquitin-protein ligase NRDP1
MKKKKITREQRLFTEKEKLEKYLTCPICQDIFEDPYRITCGHTYCQKCLTQWEKTSKFCPLCRKIYNKRYSGRDLLAQTMINDAIVTCIYKGCPWKEKLSKLQNHIDSCLFEPNRFPNLQKWFQSSNTKKVVENLDSDENDIGNICSFNYNTTIKERIFYRNPNLIEKLFGKNENEKKKIEIKEEKICDNDDVNELYNNIFSNDDKSKTINISLDEKKGEKI